MASLIRPADPLPTGYRGLSEFFEFTNHDGRHTKFNCGQAAACTYLAYLGLLKPSDDAMGEVEREHPPDNLGGWFGTSRRCVERIGRTRGACFEEVTGENELRWHLAAGRPVIVMLGVPGPRLWRWTLPAGHWMVAYGFDAEFVYLSNWGRMSWDEFRVSWRSMIPRLIGMREQGLTHKPRDGRPWACARLIA